MSNVGDLLLKIGEFFANFADFLRDILFAGFEVNGFEVNLLNVLFIVGIGYLIIKLIIKIFV